MGSFVRRSGKSVSPPGRLLRWSRAVFAATTVAVAAAALAGWRPPVRAQAWAYLALMVGVSLPHGGYEHVENLLGRGTGFQWRYVAAYLALTGASLAVFAVAPLAGFALALAVTVVKGGHGGLAVLARTTGDDHLWTPGQRALAAAVRGGAVMVVPMVAHPGVFRMVSAYMVGLFDASVRLGWLFAPGVRAVLGAAYAGALVGHLWLGHSLGGGPAWRVEAGETLLLVAFFAVVPPILAVGLYFPFWYATRQVARLDAAGGLPRSGRAALVRIARRGLLPWLGALALLAGAAAAVPNPPTDVYGWVALYSVFVAVIAVPHVAVGSWLDRRQGIWSTS